MSPKIDAKQEWAVASYALHDAYTDFVLSRQAMLCSPQTIRFYNYTAGKFIKYLEENGVPSPEHTTARHIRAYLSNLVDRRLSDSYIHGHARAIRTLIRFWHTEKYIPEIIPFHMPKIANKRLPVLLTCPPKTDPGRMRESVKKEAENDQKRKTIHTGTNHHHIARS